MNPGRRPKWSGIQYLVLAFAALSLLPFVASAQSTCASPNANPTLIRGEGLTEQVADLQITCTGTGGLINLQLFVSPAVPLTSKLLNAGTGATEALAVTSAGSTHGVLSGNSIIFTGLQLPSGNAIIKLTNVRMNAAVLSIGSGIPPAIQETVFVSGDGVVPTALASTTVAYVATGLAQQAAVSTNYSGCSTLTPSSGPAFSVRFGENFAAAFKTQGGISNSTLGSEFTANTETGFFDNLGLTNVANSATRVRIAFSNVPAGVTVYVPTAVAGSSQTATTPALRLTTSESGVFLAVAPVTGAGIPTSPAMAPVAVSAGVGTAIYEVTAQNPQALDSFAVPVYLAGTSAALTTSPITAVVNLAPVGASANVPDFAIAGSLSLTATASSSCPFPLSISPGSLTSATQGGFYTQQLTAGPDPGTQTWSLVAGNLPAGLSLSASTGIISGTPTVAGTFVFTAGVTDSLAGQASRQFTLQVATALQISANPSVCSAPVATPRFVRAEGTSEQVADLVFTCVGGGGPANIQLLVLPSLRVSSKVLNLSTGVTEAVAVIGAAAYQGTVSGSALNFAVQIPGGSSTVTITNVRLDATSLSPLSGVPVLVSETPFLTGAGVVPGALANTTVAFVVPGLGTQSISGVRSFSTCSPILASSGPAFTVAFGENIATSFKTQGDASNSVLGSEFLSNTETGYFLTGNGITNQANAGTRVRILFKNIPAGLSVYVPTSVSAVQGAVNGVISLTTSETGVFSAVTPLIPGAGNGLPASSALAQVAVVAGSGEAIYEVTVQNPNATETYSVPVYVGASAGVAPLSLPMTATVDLAPTGSALIPNFTPVSAPLTASNFTFCLTSSTLPVALVGVPYAATLTPSGGTTPYTFLTNAVLPAGLHISALGAISGVPTAASNGFFGSVTVVDGAGVTQNFAVGMTVVPSGPSTCANAVATPVNIRNVGLSEQLADLQFTCSGSGGVADLQVALAPTPNFASKVLNSSTGASEAMAITSVGSVPGIDSGLAMTFTGLQIPAGAATVTITNVRINASSLAIGTRITAAVNISGAGVVAGSLNAVVATVANAVSMSGAGVTNYTLCSPISASGGPAFTLRLSEGFASAFKTRGGASNSLLGSEFSANTETGFFVNGAITNQASAGTRLRILFRNVPVGLNLYVPTSVSAVEGAVNGVLTLTATEAGAFSAVAALSPTSGNTLPASPALAQVPITSGSGQAVYEVVLQNPLIVESYSVQVFVATNGGMVPLNVPITATLDLSPVGITANIPDFAPVSIQFTGSSFSNCFTSSSLPTGQVGNPYSATVPISGGAPPYVFSTTTALLPPGLGINTAGAITGTPTAANSGFAGSVTVTDSNSVTAPVPIVLQVIPANTTVCSTPGSAAHVIRAPGVTEQVGDLTFNCFGTGGIANLSVSMSGSLPITSKLLNPGTGETEALAINPSGTVAGIRNGSSLVFSGLTIPPGNSTVTITNVRVNAAVSQTTDPIQEIVAVSGTGITTATLSPVAVASVRPGLQQLGISNVTHYSACSPVLASGGPAFRVNFGEYLRSFKLQGGPSNSTLLSWLNNNTETGYFTTSGTTNNQANAGTRLRILFQNVPAGLQVYVPTSVSANNGATNGVITLTASETGPFAAVAPLTPTTGNSLPDTLPLAQVPISAGSGTAIYEITVRNPQDPTNQSFSVQVFVATAGGLVPLNVPMTATVDLAPLNAPGNLPDFSPRASTYSGSSFATFCQTTVNLPPSKVGAAYNATITPSGGLAPYTFSTTATLPPGLTLSSGGVVSGTPTTATPSFNGSVLATDSNGVTGQVPVQLAVYAVGGSTCANPIANPKFIRSEGVTELTGDLQFTCTGNGGFADITAFVSPGLNVTSKVLNGATGATEALATTSAGSGQGIVNGNSVVFSGVLIPSGTSTVSITNVRVNAASLSIGPGVPPAISETMFVNGPGVVPAALAQTVVAYAQNGLGTQTLSGVTNYLVCAPILAANGPAFTLKLQENFASAFKSQAGETGVPVANGNVNNTANAGTRLRLFFQNIPTGLNVYVPLSATSPTGAGVITLTSSGTGAFAAVTPATGNSLPGSPALGQIAVSAGTGNAIYEVTVQDPSNLASYTLPIYVGTTTGIVALNAPISVTTSFAPVSLSSNIPNFVVSSSTTPLYGSSFRYCPVSLPTAQVGVPYSAHVTPPAGTAPYTFGPAVLPDGLTISAGGTITGIPTTLSSSFVGSVTVVDNAGVFEVFPIGIQVLAAAPLSILTTTLATGGQNVPYGQSVAVSGGLRPYVWSVPSGALTGTGLSLNTTTGVLSGTPAATGTFPFTVTVTDQLGTSVSQPMSLQVIPPVVLTGITNGADASPAPLAPGSLAFINGSGLATSTATAGPAVPFSLGGVTVTVNGLAAPVAATGSNQLLIQIPYGTAPGAANVVVSNLGVLSNSLPFRIVPAAVGIFNDGAGHATGTSLANPGVAGTLASISVTGLGTLNPLVADGASGPMAQPAPVAVLPVSVTVAGVNAPVFFAGMSPGQAAGTGVVQLTVPALATGAYPLIITANGIASASQLIYVQGPGGANAPPAITSLLPATVPVNSVATQITIMGRNFAQASNVSWTSPNGAVSSIAPAMIQPNRMTVMIPPQLLTSAGLVQVSVSDPTSGQPSNTAAFTVRSSEWITSVTPGVLPAGSAPVTITVIGRNFVTGSTLSWTAPNGTITPLVPTLIQPSQITATVPANLLLTAGTALVQVSDPSGNLSNPGKIVIRLAAISVSPSSAPYGSPATPIVITGSGFNTGSTLTWTGPNGVAATVMPTVVQQSQISATLPAALLSNAGTARITVNDPSGAFSNPLSFDITTPVPITSLSPNQTLIGSGNTPVTITGAAFTPGSVLKWAGPDGQNVSISPALIQASQIAAILPAPLLTSAGTAQVAIMDGSGVLSNQLPFTISPFLITSATPNSATSGDAASQIAINGSSLGTATTFTWTAPDGSKTVLPLTLQGSTRVLVTVPARLLMTPGTALLALSNQLGSSNALPFTIGPLNPLSIQTTSLAPVLSGTPYAVTLSATGGSSIGPYTWQFASSPPPFLALSAAGVLSPFGGTSFLPADAGSYTFAVQVTDLAGNAVTRQLTLNIYSGLTITTASPLPPAMATQRYSLNLAGIGGAGSASYVWSATGLPSWLTLSAAGLLSGTPPADTPVTLTVTLSDGATTTSPQPITLPVNSPTGQVWTQLSPTGTPPTPRHGHAAAFDTATGQMIVFGGGVASGTLYNDLWSLSSATNQWTQLAPGGTPPAARTGMSASYDSTGSRLMIFGGATSLAACTNDVWVLNNASGAAGNPVWAALNPAGTAPVARIAHQSVYDATSNRLIIFGGSGCEAGLYNDVWVLTNANGAGGTPVWTALTPTGSAPPARANFSAVYDAPANKLIVFGGAGPTANSGDVWVLSNANGLGGVPAWTMEAPGGASVQAVSGHTAIGHATSNRMTVFGGFDTVSTVSDTWALSGANGSSGTPAWTKLAPIGALPAPRSRHSAVYDTSSNRMLVFGGTDQTNSFNDVWALSDANGAISISSLAPASTTAGGVGFPLSVTGQGFAFGAVIKWNGTALATTFVSTMQLTAIVPAALIAGQGSAAITVVNPNLAASSAAAFSIQAAPPASGGGSGGGGGGGSALTASPGTFTFTVPAGKTPATQSLTLSFQTYTQGPVTYSSNATTNSGSGWLSLSPSSGAMSQVSYAGFLYTYQATVNVTVNPSGISAGSSYSGTVNVQAGGGIASASVTMNVTAANVNAPDLVLSTSVGKPVSGSLAPAGGTAPYKCTIRTGTLPAGVSLNSDCSVSGSATLAGNAAATVTITDSQGATGMASVTVNVLGLITSSLPPGAVFQPYSAGIVAAGGSPPYAFTATGVPAGLSLSGAGVLSGSVRTVPAGPIMVSVTVSDSKGQSASAIYSLTISAPVPINISSGALPDATVSIPYSQVFTASGGNPPYTWSLIGGALPAGLFLSAAGTLSGVPTGPGPAGFAVQATDNSGGIASVLASLTVKPAPLMVTTRSPLPSGVVGLEFPAQALGASGGTPPYTFSLTGGSLPAGMSLANGVVGGIPGAAGDFPIAVTVSDAASPAVTASANLGLNIRGMAPDLLLTDGSLSFSVAAGASALPPAQNVGVQSTVVSQNLAYTVAVNPASPWLSVSSGGTTPGVLSVGLTSQALTLPPGGNQATIVLTCTSPSCTGKTQEIAVNLAVTTAPPQLSVQTDILSLSSTTSPSQPQSQDLTLQNSGGGKITINSISCEASWCSAGSYPASLPGGMSAGITITADPAQLGYGFYRTALNISTSAGSVTVPVTFLVSKNSGMSLSPSGSQINMQQGGAPGNPTGSILISVAGSPVSWSASVQPGADWLILNTTSGNSTASQPGSLTFTINPSVAGSLAAQTYYGVIRIDAPGVINAPQDFQVILTVHAAGDPVRPDPQPAGLVFLTSAGTSPPPQQVNVYAGSTAALTWTAATDGSAWLSATPSGGSVSAVSPGISTVTVNSQGLAPGVYRGGISYALSGATVRTVSVTLVVSASVVSESLPAATRSVGQSLESAAAGCVPSLLVPAQTGLTGNFSAAVGQPSSILVRLVNDCGGAVTGGKVTAAFSDGDASIVLSGLDNVSGVYSGTWVPRTAASQVTVATQATAPGLTSAAARVIGSVAPGISPQLVPHGTVNAFNPQVGAALAPGTIVAVYGSNLSSGTARPDSIPLPTSLANASVLIGGLPAPLYYVSPGQINAQVPFELDPAKRYQVVVQSNGALTAPDSIQLAPVVPGLAVLGDGTLLAQHGDGSLVSQAAAARPGEYVVAYLLGMGATDFPVISGAASPADPLARPAVTPVLTLGGTQVPIAFAGLTPGLVGLYQMNFQIPADAPGGNLSVVVSQAGISSNSAILPVHQ